MSRLAKWSTMLAGSPLKKSSYQLVDELDAIDKKHQERQSEINLSQKSFLFLLSVGLEVCMKNFEREIAIANILLDLWFIIE